jgi:hypothetical protein
MQKEMNFSITPARKASKKDLSVSLAIYVENVDSNGITNTNEILYYIENPKVDKKREMFFFVLYHDSEVCGFAEAGFLHEIDAIIIDYLCTNPRNPTLFLNFYNLIVNAIEDSVNKPSVYKITELSTTKNSENKLSDMDSNYFRKVLSFENFKIIRAPYYVPSQCLRKKETEMEYNLVISGNFTSLTKALFLAIVKCLYEDHYLTWYLKFDKDLANEAKEHIEYLFQKVQSEISKKDKIYEAEFLLVNCKIYEEGKCTHVDIQNLSRKRRRKKSFYKFLLLALIVVGAVTTGLLTTFIGENKLFTAVGTTITAGLAILEIIRSIKSK